jgi:hypothetical protein
MWSISRRNYHGFLTSQEVLSLSYITKIFLLNVLKEYDEKLYEYEKSNRNQKDKFSQDLRLNSKKDKTFPWNEASLLTSYF